MNFNKILTAIVIIIVLVVGSYFYLNTRKAAAPEPESSTMNNEQPDNSSTVTPSPSAGPSAPTAAEIAAVPASAVATIDTNMGAFQVTLNGKAAPTTVANFIKLANAGFYNNLTFHRIVSGFMIQGGDPKGDGTGGPGYTIPAEIGLKHTAGAIAMARLGDQVNPTKASSGSQFYVTLAPQTSLDGQYTVFGYVTFGMDVVTKIGSTPTDVNPATGEQSTPLQKVIINKITIK